MKAAATDVSHITLKKLPDFEKLKHCFECGICTASCPMAELIPNAYNPRNLLEKIFLDIEDAAHAKELWLCAWCYRCYKRCPQNMKVPELLQTLKIVTAEQHKLSGFEDTVKLVVENVPLPVIAYYTCFHPERAGIDLQKIRQKLDAAVEKHRKKELANKPQHTHSQKVAVIGSGPAGLTVAHELAKKGYPVTVFEALPQAGGMLRKCIPAYRLPQETLDDEIQHIQNVGAEIRTGVAIGKDIAFNNLWRDGFKAIFVAVGAHGSRKLGVEGEDLTGVLDALDFLYKVNCGEQLRLGSKVAVIGGGNVAVDAAITARKQGAEEVTILYRRTREEMPANPWEIAEAEREGVKIEFLAGPKEILGENGKAVAVECVRMQLGEPDATGRRAPMPVEGSEFRVDAGTVILAVGEQPELDFLPEQVAVERGVACVNPFTMETTMRGVFAGGDAVTGPASVIEAILAGRKAAESITRHLEHEAEQK